MNLVIVESPFAPPKVIAFGAMWVCLDGGMNHEWLRDRDRARYRHASVNELAWALRKQAEIGETNLAYARRALADSLRRGEAPFASHLLYPQVLDDADPAQRRRGIDAGLTWGAQADLTAVYVDRGVTDGMRLGIERAQRDGRPVVQATLGGGRANDA
ncbi:MAG TPA: hypothetical protein VFB99_10415 [Vicinamibacterales bacterium]|nr:hypothetical protein [Vicinamibacterales bacterium]